MDGDSFQNQPQINLNQSHYSNVDYDALTAELHSFYYKYKASNNKKELVRGLLQKTDFGKLFYKLVANNYVDEIIYLLESFEFSNKDNINDLFFLVIEKHKNRVVEYMIKNDFINLQEIRDKEGNTGLLTAAIFSNVQAAKIIIKFDAQMVEVKNKHQIDPLTVAVYNNDTLMFFLVANNLSIPILNSAYLCKLAIRNENLDIFNYLTNKNPAVFTEDETLLHYACSQKNSEILRIVMKHCKNFDFKDESEETALHWSVMKGSYHIVEELIHHIKENNALINPRNKFGVTPFHLACLKQDKHVSHLLFENGADVNEQDSEGNSVIHIAAAIGDLKWLKYVVKHFNINCYLKNKHGNTPFMVACIAGKYDVVRYFCDKIPSLNWKNNKGQTPLHAVVFGGHLHILELLLTHKADITVKDINGLTPYHYAYAEKKADVIEIIHKVLGLEADKLH